MNDSKKSGKEQSQSEKFKRLAREVEADEDEESFKRKLKRLAKAKLEKGKPSNK